MAAKIFGDFFSSKVKDLSFSVAEIMLVLLAELMFRLLLVVRLLPVMLVSFPEFIVRLMCLHFSGQFPIIKTQNYVQETKKQLFFRI